MDTVGSTTVSLNGGNPVTLSSGSAVLTGVTLSGAGSHTITANYAGVSGTFQASTNTTTITVSKDTETIAGPSTQPVQLTVGQSGSIPITVTGPFSMVPRPTGSLTYNILNSGNTSVASGSAVLTAGSTNSTATIPVPNTLDAGSYTVSVSYAGDSNYAASSTPTTIQLSVGQITPTISWTPPATTITVGATLSAILNATASDGRQPIPGTFSYTATVHGWSTCGRHQCNRFGSGAVHTHRHIHPDRYHNLFIRDRHHTPDCAGFCLEYRLRRLNYSNRLARRNRHLCFDVCALDRC